MFKKLFGFKKERVPARNVAELLRPLAVPALHLVKHDSPTRSHFGGNPRLPSGIEWPSRGGKPLQFLACVSLEEVHASLQIDWLPGSGTLLFFYDTEDQLWGFDPKDRGSWAVLYHPDDSNEANLPSKSAIPHANIGFRVIDTYPSWERPSVEALGLNEEEFEDLSELQYEIYEELPAHQIGGFPSIVQGDGMELECQLASNGLCCGDTKVYNDPRAASLKPGAADWKLLLQIDTDDDLNIMWGDCGMIYFWVREQEARSGDFSNAWLLLQCG